MCGPQPLLEVRLWRRQQSDGVFETATAWPTYIDFRIRHRKRRFDDYPDADTATPAIKIANDPCFVVLDDPVSNAKRWWHAKYLCAALVGRPLKFET